MRVVQRAGRARHSFTRGRNPTPINTQPRRQPSGSAFGVDSGGVGTPTPLVGAGLLELGMLGEAPSIVVGGRVAVNRAETLERPRCSSRWPKGGAHHLGPGELVPPVLALAIASSWAAVLLPAALQPVNLGCQRGYFGAPSGETPQPFGGRLIEASGVSASELAFGASE